MFSLPKPLFSCTARNRDLRLSMSTVREPRPGLESPAPEPVQALTVPLRSALVVKPPAGYVGLPRIAGYEIMHVLGQGGMSTVYLASHLKLKRRVAIKMIKREDWDDPAQRERFRKEAQSIASLQHPNIVQIFEVGETDGAPFLALEYISGGTLSRHIGGRPLPVKHAARIAQQLAEAIQFAHDRQIIHRDLKPGNILLSAEPNTRPDGHTPKHFPGESSTMNSRQVPPLTRVPKITDFGLARLLTDANRQTQSGMAIGTPSYMAPEQAAGKSDQVGKPADIYGLGTILYEMLTGRPPFEGDTILETVQLVRREEPVPPGRLNRKVPRDLETICLKCLEKEPSRRYASAHDLALDLERFLNKHPVLARPVGLPGRTMKWARRRPTEAIATVGGFMLFTGLVIYLATVQTLLGRLKYSNAQLEVKTHQLEELTEQEKSRNRNLRGLLKDSQTAPGEWLKLAESEPDDVWAQLRAADALLAQNQPDEARAYLNHARKLAREAVRQPSATLSNWGDLAAVHDRTSEMHRQFNDESGSWNEQTTSRQLREWIVEQDSESPRWRFDLCMSLLKLARMHLERESMEDDHVAVMLLRRRLELLTITTGGVDLLQAKLHTHELLAEVHIRLGDMSTADAHVNEAKSIRVRLYSNKPKVPAALKS